MIDYSHLPKDLNLRAERDSRSPIVGEKAALQTGVRTADHGGGNPEATPERTDPVNAGESTPRGPSGLGRQAIAAAERTAPQPCKGEPHSSRPAIPPAALQSLPAKEPVWARRIAAWIDHIHELVTRQARINVESALVESSLGKSLYSHRIYIDSDRVTVRLAADEFPEDAHWAFLFPGILRCEKEGIAFFARLLNWTTLKGGDVLVAYAIAEDLDKSWALAEDERR